MKAQAHAPHVEHAPGTLLKTLATSMRVRGPMTIKEFMTSALTHPVHGYYMQQGEVFGRGGDFVTSPEVSQVFGELLGVWCVASWERLGRPSKLRLIEMGPGRGTLMADVLRSTAIFDGFHSALSVHMVEVSSHLQGVQKETLRGAAAEEVAIDWHDSLERVPSDKDVPELTLAHEFLDALPVHQLVRTPRGWRERMVDLSEHVPETNVVEAIEPSVRDLNKDERSLDFVLSANPTPASLLFGERLGERTGSERSGAAAAIADDADDNASVLGCLEVCPGALSFTQQLCRRIVKSRGAALFIDYGTDGVPNDTLRGILNHQAVHPLHQPGAVDLSVDVDFGAIRDVARDEGKGLLRCPPLANQRDFLAAMGLEARVNTLLKQTTDREMRRNLIQSAGRLVASPGMGTAYKVFAIAHGDVGMEGVAGFGKAPLLEATSPAVEAEADDDGPDPAAGRTIRKVRVPSK